MIFHLRLLTSSTTVKWLAFAALHLAILPSCSYAQPQPRAVAEAPEAPAEARVPLTSIGAVSSLDAEPDPDDPGAGGGIDMIAMFKNRYIPKLTSCTMQMENIFTNWASTNELEIPYRKDLPGDLTLHATGPKTNGLFELIYRVTPSRERARVTVFFVSASGEATSVAKAKSLIESWGIAALQDDLDMAMSCDA